MLFDDRYQEILSPAEGIFKDKGSKFIARAFPVYHEEEIKGILEMLRKEYYDARHHCYAYILNPDKSSYRINDDGEPSGSAGKPIYGQLLSKDLTNILVVVIRYFGGTKLGIPGLINAYKTATQEALSQAVIVHKTVNDVFELQFDYPLMNSIIRILKEENLEASLSRFELNCLIEVPIPKSQSMRIQSILESIHGLQLQYLRSL
jgi:uncharacterized YigZ family protein